MERRVTSCIYGSLFLFLFFIGGALVFFIRNDGGEDMEGGSFAI